jgi:hypothetical protein
MHNCDAVCRAVVQLEERVWFLASHPLTQRVKQCFYFRSMSRSIAL